MVVKVKEKFEKTRHVKIMISLKYILYVDKEMQDIIKEYYKTNKILRISQLSSVQKSK